MRQVCGWGNPAARYVLVGEAPGPHEEETGEPFVGASGWRLKEWWGRAGLKREDFRIENVCEFRPPHNNIDAFDTAYIQQWMQFLHQRLARLDDPWLIVPTGNYALYALTGKGKVKWHTHDGKETRAGITDWRGSILEYTDLNGHKIKVVPTIHPAATFRQPDYEGVCIRDWIKIAYEGTFRETRLPARVHATKPTLLEVDTYLNSLQTGDVVAVDIENPKPKDPTNEKVIAPIVCLAFASRPDASLTIPVTRHYWGSQDIVEQVWKTVGDTLSRHDIEWVFHNGLYDTFHLAWERNLHVGYYRYDTLLMHHCLDPSDWHSLDYCASRDTRQPFWKSDWKTNEGICKAGGLDESLWHYNGIDACVTRELYDVYHERLAAQGRLDFYLRHYANLLEPLQALQLHGIKIDDTKRKLRLAHLMADCLELQDQLEEATGLKLYGKSSLSNTKLKHYLYDVLGLPKQERARKERGDKTVTADELAVRRLMLKHKKALEVTGPLILAHKRKSKLREFCDEGRTDADNYFRSSYSLNTEAGRLSSKANPNGTGGNAQNQDRELRDMFLPDEGMIGIEVDGSQVEARIDYALIYMLTGNKALYEKAVARPDEYDQHTENASVIFQVPTEAVTKQQRFIGKSCVHGAFRDMQGKKLSENLLKDGYVMDPAECTRYINAFKQRVPGIDELFRWCRRNVIEHRFVESTWGHRLYFTYDRFSDDLYRKAYSFYPQCCDDKTEVLTPSGFVPFTKLDGGEDIAVWRPSSNSINFEKPLRLVAEAYDGPLHYAEGLRASLAVTPNHKQVYWDSYKKCWSNAEIQHLWSKERFQVPVCGDRVGGEHVSRSLIQLLVATQADGTFRHKTFEVRWHLSKAYKIHRLRRLLDRAGVACTQSHLSDGSTEISTGATWYTVATMWLGKEKQFNDKFLGLDLHSLQTFVRELGRWDSSKAETLTNLEKGKTPPGFAYLSTIEQNADIAQAAATMCGYRAYKKCDGGYLWRVNMTRTTKTAFIMQRNRAVRPYKGTVYCVTTSSGFFVTRRNGKVCVTGNSDCAGWMNSLGLVPFFWYIEEQSRREGVRIANINVHAHDALFFSVLPQYAYDATKFLVDSMEQNWILQPKHTDSLRVFRVPCEIKAGTSWKCSHEFRRMPNKNDFDACIADIINK